MLPLQSPRLEYRPLASTQPLALATYRVRNFSILELLEVRLVPVCRVDLAVVIMYPALCACDARVQESPVALTIPAEWLRWRIFCLKRAQTRVVQRTQRSRDGVSFEDTVQLRHLRRLSNRCVLAQRRVLSLTVIHLRAPTHFPLPQLRSKPGSLGRSLA